VDGAESVFSVPGRPFRLQLGFVATPLFFCLFLNVREPWWASTLTFPLSLSFWCAVCVFAVSLPNVWSTKRVRLSWQSKPLGNPLPICQWQLLFTRAPMLAPLPVGATPYEVSDYLVMIDQKFFFFRASPRRFSTEVPPFVPPPYFIPKTSPGPA